MKRLLCVVISMLALAACQQNKPETEGKPQTEEQKVSYIIGMQIAQQSGLKTLQDQMGYQLDAKRISQGLSDVLANKDPQLNKDEVASTMEGFKQKMQAKQKEMQDKQQAEMKVAGDKNEAEGKAYLEANAKKEGVKVTKSGLQYKVLTEGKGKKPSANDTVTVNYRGTLVNGKEFDSSAKHGGPATFSVGALIPGWTEALQMMPVGSKWEITVPANLAYGANGPSEIGPNAVLVFEMELLSIQETKPAKKK